MTLLSEKSSSEAVEQNGNHHAALPEKTPPEILTEEDAPLFTQPGSNPLKDELTKEKNIKDLLDEKKFSLGSNTLGWCIFLMFVCVIISIFVPDNTLVENAFDAFKLIVMTILGYIFGSNTKC